MATLATEKEQLDTETQSLEKRKTELERGNRWIEKTIVESKAANKQLTEENAMSFALNRGPSLGLVR